MKNYFRIMPGSKCVYFPNCKEDDFIGADFDISHDLTDYLKDSQTFKSFFDPIWVTLNATKISNIAMGLARNSLWNIVNEISIGDIVLVPDGDGNYYFAEVAGGYYYVEGKVLPHRRKVKWFESPIKKEVMSEAFQNSLAAHNTCIDIKGYADEIGKLLEKVQNNNIFSPNIESDNYAIFSMEKYLEEFLCANWQKTELGKSFNIYTDDDGNMVGKQYYTDTGPIDILAISKDQKELLVVELKKGRASDSVVGQIQRYMGYVKAELTEEGQTVKGVIIALEDDKKIQRALSVTTNIDFYRYKVNFELFKA